MPICTISSLKMKKYDGGLPSLLPAIRFLHRFPESSHESDGSASNDWHFLNGRV